MYSGITSGRVLNGELLYTKILEVNLFAFAYRLFRRDFSPLDGTYCIYIYIDDIWMLKDKKISYSLKWKIIDRGRAYKPSGKNCSLCDLEKFHIIFKPELASLNQRNELATSCRHRRKYLLCNN